MPSPHPVSPAPDRCPGALRPHAAADGALVRLRLPGGQISGPALAVLGELAGTFGDADVHLTSRGNLQLRGLADPLPDGLAEGLAAAGLLPSQAHERVRNIVASPLSGIAGGRADVRTLVPELDRLLRAQPGLAELSGRFLFGLDDGRGDLATLRPDVWARFLDPDRARLGVGGFAGPIVCAAEVPAALIALAGDFLAVSEGRWHARQLPDGGRGLLVGASADSPQAPEPMPYGLLGAATSVLVPLGVLGPQQLSLLSGFTDVVVTPWRGLVLPGAMDLGPLTAAGLVADAGSPWTRITACIGAPGCAKSAGDTHSAARALAAEDADTGPPIHIIGCERACGAPTFDHERVLVRSKL